MGSQFAISRGVTLKSMSAKPIAIANAKIIWPRASPPRLVGVLPLLARGDVRGDREGAEADRERLAERDHAAHDREPEEPVALHEGLDGARDVLDVAVGRPDGHGPV